MEKLVYVLWPQVGLAEGELREAVLGEIAGRCRQAGARHMAASLVDEHVEQPDVIGLRTRLRSQPCHAGGGREPLEPSKRRDDDVAGHV